TGGMLLTLVVVAKLGVQGAVIGIAINNILILTGVVIASFRRYRPKLSLNFRFVSEAWRYGLKAWVADVVGFSNVRLDQWILGAAAAPALLGLYSQAVVIAEMPWMLPDSLGFVLLNKVAAERNAQEQAILVERMHRMVFWTMALVGTAVALLAPWMILILFGR